MNFSHVEREFSRPGTSLGMHARRTEARDAKRANDLVQSYTHDVFGRIQREENVSYLL